MPVVMMMRLIVTPGFSTHFFFFIQFYGSLRPLPNKVFAFNGQTEPVENQDGHVISRRLLEKIPVGMPVRLFPRISHQYL